MRNYKHVGSDLPVLKTWAYPKLPPLMEYSFLVVPDISISSHKRDLEVRWVIGIWITACVRAGQWQPIAQSTFNHLVKEAFLTKHADLAKLSPEVIIKKAEELTAFTWGGWMTSWSPEVDSEPYLVLDRKTFAWLNDRDLDIKQTFSAYPNIGGY